MSVGPHETTEVDKYLRALQERICDAQVQMEPRVQQRALVG